MLSIHFNQTNEHHMAGELDITLFNVFIVFEDMINIFVSNN